MLVVVLMKINRIVDFVLKVDKVKKKRFNYIYIVN